MPSENPLKSLTFMATAAGALKGQASGVLRYRFGGAAREKVLGRYPALSLKDAREATRQNRARIRQGVDAAAEKRAERLKPMNRSPWPPSRKPDTTATSPTPTSTPRSCCASSAAASSRRSASWA